MTLPQHHLQVVGGEKVGFGVKQRFTPSSAMLLQSNLLHGHSHSLSALITEQVHLPVCRRVGKTICKC